MNGFQIPVLRSSRLVLRAIRADDHAGLLALARDPQVARHLHEGPPPSPGEVWQRMAAALGQWALRGYGVMAVDDEAGLVGRLGFFHPFELPDPLLVYALARRGWGRGYATEGARLALDYLRAAHGPRRVTSLIDPDNLASARVARKLGAVREGTAAWAGATLQVWAFAPRSDPGSPGA